MKTKMKKLNGTAREFLVEIPKKIIDETLEQVYSDIKKSAKIDGFRPGKVPMDIVKNNYKGEADDEMRKILIPEAYQKALIEHEINPVSYPDVSDVAVDAKGALMFKAVVDVHPEISLKKYKGLKVNVSKVSVSDKELEETLDRLRNINAEFIDVNRPLKKGDFGICDAAMILDGKVISQKRDNMWIEVDKEASLFGVGEKLEGLKKGDKKEIMVTLPETYQDEKYAGKEVVMDVEVKETKEKKLSELNDEFAVKLGKKTMKEVNDEIKDQLLQKKEHDFKINMKTEIMDQLLKSHSFDVPQGMVKRQQKVLTERAENDLLKKGVNQKAIEENREKLSGKIYTEAENKIRLYFILDAIATEEKIEIADKEVEDWIKTLAASYNRQFDEVKKYYEENNLIGGVMEELREEKTLDFVLGEANKVEGKSK